MASKKALGKGLRALIPDIAPDMPDGDAIKFIEVAKVEPNPFQPRGHFDEAGQQELRSSIHEKGVIQPITVRRHDNGYQLIAGERRLRAVRDLEMETIPAYILDVQSDEEMLELAIIENIHREDLNPIDIANGYKRLIEECHLTQEEVAQKVGKDRSTVTNFLRLLRLPGPIQKSLQEGGLSMGHARPLLSLSDKEDQMDIWKRVLKNNLSVRRVEELVRTFGKNENTKPQERDIVTSYYFTELEDRLRSRLATQVKIKPKQKGGSIEVDYYSDDELDRLIALICDD